MTLSDLHLAIICALCWGFLWAAFLQFHHIGKWLARRRTWITVVIGIGVDGLIILIVVLPMGLWLECVAIISASAVGIIARSLYNESNETRRQLADLRPGDLPE